MTTLNTDNAMAEARTKWWTKGIVSQHNPEHIKNWLDGIFTFSSVVRGRHGDVTIINLESDVVQLGDETIALKGYLSHCFMIDRIEKKGIYTNIYFKRSFFTLAIRRILDI